jgi:hypothetical protein
MKNKKGLIILSSVIVVCAVGLIVSPLVNWPVDKNSASGNISKSSRFSRKTADEGLSNMEELIKSDPSYKDGIVTAYMVMHTRAQQFSALVDMSNEVAGDIPEYADVIDEMNKVYVTVNNVCASLIRAGENINATLNGEKRPDLAQNTINASLAYTTLQKQNKLATQFIEVTDEYVKKNEASDRLLFVRDQWVDYQLMTAALEGDTKSAEALEKKGNLLTSEKTVAALGSFNLGQQVAVLQSANIASTFDVNNTIASSVPGEIVSNVFNVVGNTIETAVQNVQSVDELASAEKNIEIASELRNNFVSNLSNTIESENFVKAMGWNVVGSNAGVGNVVGSSAAANDVVGSHAGASDVLGSQVMSSFNIVGMNIGTDLVSSFQQMSSQIKIGMNAAETELKSSTICGELGSFINSTAMGSRPTVNFL